MHSMSSTFIIIRSISDYRTCKVTIATGHNASEVTDSAKTKATDGIFVSDVQSTLPNTLTA